MSISLGELFVNLAVGALFYYFGLRAQRPSLFIAGSGRSGGAAEHPGWLVLTLSVHNSSTVWGVAAERQPARNVNANLRDPVNDRPEGPSLKWQVDGGTTSSTVDIAQGRGAQLVLFFARESEEWYTMFEPAGSGLREPKHPLKLGGARREFTLMMFDHLGREYRLGFTVEHSQGLPKVVIRPTLQMRLTRLHIAWLEFRGAFRRSG